MNFKYKSIFGAVLASFALAVVSGQAMAQKKPVAAVVQADAQLDALKEQLAKNAGSIPLPAIVKVERTPVANIFEAQLADGNIVYFDEKAGHLLIGTMLDVKTRENLTQKKINALAKINWKDLPLKNAIKEVRGNGKRMMVVFSDPNCPYCKKLEQEIEKLENVTVYTFLIPILSADSKVKSDNIWCSKDKIKTYKNWMLNGTIPESKTCKTPVEENGNFAKSLKVQSTPTVYFPNGERSMGWVEAKALEGLLVKGNEKTK